MYVCFSNPFNVLSFFPHLAMVFKAVHAENDDVLFILDSDVLHMYHVFLNRLSREKKMVLQAEGM